MKDQGQPTTTASRRNSLDEDGIMRIRMPVDDDIVEAAERLVLVRFGKISRADVLVVLTKWAIAGQRMEACRVMFEAGIEAGKALRP